MLNEIVKKIIVIENYIIAALGCNRIDKATSFNGEETRDELLNRLNNLTYIVANIPPSVTQTMFLENYGTTQFSLALHRVCFDNMRKAVDGLYN